MFCLKPTFLVQSLCEQYRKEPKNFRRWDTVNISKTPHLDIVPCSCGPVFFRFDRSFPGRPGMDCMP